MLRESREIEDDPHGRRATMALKQDRKSSTEGAARIRERGHIYFFYRPKVDARVVRGLDDVERFLEKSLHHTAPLLEGKWE
jgi:hypothetical protein